MPEPKRKQRKERTPQAGEFLLALETANTGGSTVAHKKSLAEWLFIDHRKYECEPWEKIYLLEYELAREAEIRNVVYPSSPTWKTVFGSRFPESAFLSIDPAERRACLTAAFSEGDRGVPLFDFTKKWQGISYQFTYALREEHQDQLEATFYEGREAEKIGPGEYVVDAAVAKFMCNLPDEAYDESVAHVRMSIDFDYSDAVLRGEFAKLLKSLRRSKPVPGEKDELDADLRRLAAARLCRIFHTVQEAQRYLTDCDFDLPYKGDAGWSKARTGVKRMLGVAAPTSAKDRGDKSLA